MRSIMRLENTIQTYAWGSRTAIPALLNVAPDGRPQAELWMGAHPKAPSRVNVAGKTIGLDVLIDEYPAEVLGRETAERFSGRLPFLFKVLAAAEPLSIQAHPSLTQAREGFARENALGIPLDAPHRNYRDDNHKPEILCALTPFWALNGWRDIPQMLHILDSLRMQAIEEEMNRFRRQPDREGLRNFFHAVMRMDRERTVRCVAQAVASAARRKNDSDVYAWLVRIHDCYPGDVGVLCAAMLNVVRLEPGEAMYLVSGRLHAYLDGTGIELMANSDNVLRGGLTRKHMDVPELLETLTFQTGPVQVLAPTGTDAVEKIYPSDAAEFRLSVVDVTPERAWRCRERKQLDIVICTRGEVSMRADNDASPTILSSGMSALIPAGVFGLNVEGRGRLFRATVPRCGNRAVCTAPDNPTSVA